MKHRTLARALAATTLAFLLIGVAAAVEPAVPQSAEIPDLSGIYDVLLQGTSSQTGDPAPVAFAETATLVLYQDGFYLYGYMYTGGLISAKEALDVPANGYLHIKLQGLVTATRFWLHGMGRGGNGDIESSDINGYYYYDTLMIWGVSGHGDMIIGTFHHLSFGEGAVPGKIEPVEFNHEGTIGIIRAVKIAEIEEGPAL